MARNHISRIGTALDTLGTRLGEASKSVAAMTGSGVEAGQAQSLEDLGHGLKTALDNLHPLATACLQGDRLKALSLAEDLDEHVAKEIARPQILEDLKGVVREAQDELTGKVGKHRTPVKQFIETGRALPAKITDINTAAADAVAAIRTWAATDSQKETDMADDKTLKGIETAIQGLGKQVSFLTARQSPSAGGTSAAGQFRSVTAQMAATLDALGLPHLGVQFATPGTTDAARDTLVENLLNEFQETERNGNKVYVLGEGPRRAVSAEDSRLLAGAAKSAARRVRAEADNILDILDRLPDLNRFRTTTGALSPKDARNEVAERFRDLDVVMANPYGINAPRTHYILRRVLKGLTDFFDYANLEPEFQAALYELDLPDQVADDLLPSGDPDELAKRRSPSTSEELMFEIREVCQAYGEILKDVSAPAASKLGTAAARLEMYLTTAYTSARDFRDVAVRFGTSLPEQDLLSFNTQARAAVTPRTGAQRGRRKAATKAPVELTVDQLMDWILDVAKPFTGADFRANMRERRSLEILAGELECQSAALKSLIESGDELGFSISLYAPLRQLEELCYYIDRAHEQAAVLAGTTLAPAQAG